jgi:hypothetical protein
MARLLMHHLHLLQIRWRWRKWTRTSRNCYIATEPEGRQQTQQLNDLDNLVDN